MHKKPTSPDLPSDFHAFQFVSPAQRSVAFSFSLFTFRFPISGFAPLHFFFLSYNTEPGPGMKEPWHTRPFRHKLTSAVADEVGNHANLNHTL